MNTWVKALQGDKKQVGQAQHTSKSIILKALPFLSGSRSTHASISSLTSLMALLAMLLLHSFIQAQRRVIPISPWLREVTWTLFSFHWMPLRTLLVACVGTKNYILQKQITGEAPGHHSSQAPLVHVPSHLLAAGSDLYRWCCDTPKLNRAQTVLLLELLGWCQHWEVAGEAQQDGCTASSPPLVARPNFIAERAFETKNPAPFTQLKMEGVPTAENTSGISF